MKYEKLPAMNLTKAGHHQGQSSDVYLYMGYTLHSVQFSGFRLNSEQINAKFTIEDVLLEISRVMAK